MVNGHWLSRLAVLALVVGILGPWATSASSSPVPTHARAGSVLFLSTQFTPVNESETYRNKILSGAPVSVNFTPSDAGPFNDRVASEEQAHHVTIGLIGGLHGDLEPFAAKGYLQDLTPLLKKLKNRGFPSSILKISGFGSKTKHYYVPWMQATYIMAVNTKALKYLPKGAKVDRLTYDQLIQWGKNMQKKTGRKMIGLPAGPSGLIHRFLQGYAYPSFTHSSGVVGFRSASAVTMWGKLKQLWAVTNPQSTSYGFMQEPLLSGEVWVAWDHVARLINAVQQKPTEFRLVPAPIGPKGLGYMPVIAGLAIPKGAPDVKSSEKLIDYLTQNQQQVNTLNNLAFFPATNAKLPATLPTGVWLEGFAVKAQSHSKRALPSLLPVGLGTQGGQFNKVYTDSLHRILLNNEPIKSVLNDEAKTLQSVINAAGASCWPPDPGSKGVCHVK